MTPRPALSQQAPTRLATGLAIALFTIFLIVGCAVSTPKYRENTVHQQAGQSGLWQGRLALQVHSQPPQWLSGGFELQGQPAQGQLTLTGPLGQTVARVQWSPAGAQLTQGGRVQTYPSLDALTQALTGAALPLPALFDWLQGTATLADGWQADLSRLPEGRLHASRQQPQPPASLQLVLQFDGPPPFPSAAPATAQ